MATLLHADRLLHRPGAEAPKRRVALDFEAGRIRSIRESQETAGKGLLALPAMVNAHDHGYGIRPLDQGIADDALECWIACLQGRITVDPRLEAAVAFGRMALSGIGSTVHFHNSLAAERLPEEAVSVAQAARDIGIRVAFVCPILDRNPWIYGDQQDLLPHLDPAHRDAFASALTEPAPAFHLVDQVEDIARELDTDCFQVQYGPVGPQWCQEATLERIAENAERYGRRIHMHLLESPRQRKWLDVAYPNGILNYLDEIGFLSSRLGVAHGVHLTEEESKLLCDRGVSVAVNTSSNLRLRSGIAPVPRFLRQELQIGFGLDGAAHDDDQDYLRDLRLVARLHAGCGMRHALSPQVLLEAALGGGFRFIDGSDDYGHLAEGSRADLLVLDYAAMTANRMVDGGDEMDVLLARMRAEHVRDLYVSGRPVVRDGLLPGFDLDLAERELTARARRESREFRARQDRQIRLRDAVRSYYSRW